MAHILVVDDEPDLADSLADYLRDRDPEFRVSTAQDLQGGVSALAAPDTRFGAVDLLITDLAMKDDDHAGERLVRMAKEQDPWIMAILYTAKSEKLDRYEAFSLGAFDCVDKNAPNQDFQREIEVKARAAIRFRHLHLSDVEQARAIDAMRLFFDEAVLDALRSDPDRLKLQRRQVTIAFWDIRGFSGLCETLKEHPDLIAGFLNDYYRAAANAIAEKRGVLDKFIGDGVMALFGALEASTSANGDTDARNAVEAALSLREEFDSIVKRWSAAFARAAPAKWDIGLGCGIHTASVLTGRLGAGIRDQYTAVGPHVNLASRVEGTSRSGQIRVTATTAERIRGKYLLTELEVLKNVKNISGDFPVFEVSRIT